LKIDPSKSIGRKISSGPKSKTNIGSKTPSPLSNSELGGGEAGAQSPTSKEPCVKVNIFFWRNTYFLGKMLTF